MAKNLTEKEIKEQSIRRRKKTVSVKKLSEQIKGLRQKVTKDMKSDDERTRLTATAIALMDCTAERIGNDSSAANGHIGVTGLKKKHVTISGDRVKLKYVGKSGVEHEKEFTDGRIAKVLREQMKKVKDGDFLLTTEKGLKIKGDQVNGYLKGYGVTAKDIRGYAANHMVVNSLKNRKMPSDEKERKKVMSEVLQKVAEQVGHGKGTLRTHYLLPNIESDYVKNGKIPSMRQASSARVAQKFYIGHKVRAVADRKMQAVADSVLKESRSKVEKAYSEVFGGRSRLPDKIDVRIEKVGSGKIGSYGYDDGVLTIGENAFEKGLQMVKTVVLHELVHGAIGNTRDSDEHGEKFRRLATALGIPERFQD